VLVSGVIVSLIAGLFGFAGADWVLRKARRMGLVQHPTARSSHHRPTATGGGLGIVLGGSIACLFVAWHAIFPAILVLLASLAMAAIGLRDDIKPVRWVWRLGVQLLLLLVILIAVEPTSLPAALQLPLAWPVVTVLVLVAGLAWINFFNFMDGIDGLAGSEAVFLLIAAAGLTMASAPGVADLPVFWWLIALAVATLGFLVLNWPPAKIFMGDTGSTYLGLMIGFLALVTLSLGWVSLPQWLILAGVFVADPVVTLLRRLAQRERVYEAHRRHAYQALSRRWESHRTVTLGVIAINVLVLLPLAIAAGSNPAWAWPLVGLTYVVLVGLALYSGAGAPEEPAR
jgi:Fuc2NAc and GlcNAc transferase